MTVWRGDADRGSSRGLDWIPADGEFPGNFALEGGYAAEKEGRKANSLEDRRIRKRPVNRCEVESRTGGVGRGRWERYGKAVRHLAAKPVWSFCPPVLSVCPFSFFFVGLSPLPPIRALHLSNVLS